MSQHCTLYILQCSPLPAREFHFLFFFKTKGERCDELWPNLPYFLGPSREFKTKRQLTVSCLSIRWSSSLSSSNVGLVFGFAFQQRSIIAYLRKGKKTFFKQHRCRKKAPAESRAPTTRQKHRITTSRCLNVQAGQPERICVLVIEINE